MSATSWPKSVVILFMTMALSLNEFASAAVHKVGDSAGWTIPAIGHLDYTKWAATKNFSVGDIIVFEYNKQYHNVMRVNHQQFKSCNASSPIATYTSGHDKVLLKRHGHFYFICGSPAHCNGGQKVDINTVNNTTGGLLSSKYYKDTDDDKSVTPTRIILQRDDGDDEDGDHPLPDFLTQNDHIEPLQPPVDPDPSSFDVAPNPSPDVEISIASSVNYSTSWFALVVLAFCISLYAY